MHIYVGVYVHHKRKQHKENVKVKEGRLFHLNKLFMYYQITQSEVTEEKRGNANNHET